MQVVTEKLELPPLTLQNPDGKRLMTVDIGTTTIAMQLYDMTGKLVDSLHWGLRVIMSAASMILLLPNNSS